MIITAPMSGAKKAAPPVSLCKAGKTKFDQFQVVCINIAASRLRPVLLYTQVSKTDSSTVDPISPMRVDYNRFPRAVCRTMANAKAPASSLLPDLHQVRHAWFAALAWMYPANRPLLATARREKGCRRKQSRKRAKELEKLNAGPSIFPLV